VLKQTSLVFYGFTEILIVLGSCPTFVSGIKIELSRKLKVHAFVIRICTHACNLLLVAFGILIHTTMFVSDRPVSCIITVSPMFIVHL